jgi:hypothetical protein
MNGPESDPVVRVLLVETTKARPIYERFGTWLQCKRWIVQISEYVIVGDQFAAIEKRLEMKRLATIKEVQVSLAQLESAGFHCVDS